MITNTKFETGKAIIEDGFVMDNGTFKATINDKQPNFICDFDCINYQQKKNKLFEDFLSCEITRIENNVPLENMHENENLTNSLNLINMDEAKIVHGNKELKKNKKLCDYEVVTCHSMSPTLIEESSGCSQIHHDEHDVEDANCLNLDEDISFGLCEENSSLQEMLETTNKHAKQQFAVEFSTYAGEMKQESDIEHNDMELLNIHEERPVYECPQSFSPSPLNLEEQHGFQQDLEHHSIKEMLDTTFHNTNNDFVDKFSFGYGQIGQCKGSIGFGSDGHLPRISQQDLQEVIIKQLDLEESHLFAESIEDHGSKEMQESPMGSEGQDFLDEIMTCEGEGNDEIGTGVQQHNVYGICLEDLKLNEKKNNTNKLSNMGFSIDHDYEDYLTLNKQNDVQIEGKRYNYLQCKLLDAFSC